VIAITLGLGHRTIGAELDETPTAVDLLELLPLSADFADFGAQEKLALLPRRLTTRDAPEGSGAGPGDIGYYAPSQHLVLYYDQVGYFPGTILIGRYPAAAVSDVIALPSGTAITIGLP